MKGETAMEQRLHAQATSDAERGFAQHSELAGQIARALRTDGTTEPLKGLHLYRASAPTQLTDGISIPGFCVIAQGAKEVYLGDLRYRYDPAHYLLATIELPIVSQIIVASPEQPYLSLRLDLDPDYRAIL